MKAPGRFILGLMFGKRRSFRRLQAASVAGLLDLKPIARERGLHSEVGISLEVKLDSPMDTQRCSFR